MRSQQCFLTRRIETRRKAVLLDRHCFLRDYSEPMETRRRAVLLDNVTASKCRTTPSAKDMAAEASKHSEYAHRRRPRRPPFLRVESEGVGVTSSIRPIFMPERARARRADWAPGPGVLVELPPVALILMWRAVMPSSLQRTATSWAASIAAYGEDSSRSALTFMPPVTREMVSRPERSVTWTKVSLKEAKMRATPKTSSPSRTWGPREMFS